MTDYLLKALPLLILIGGFSPSLYGQSQSKLTYDSPTLKIKQLTSHTYQHVTFLKTEEWGNVGCNGLIYAHNGEAIVFDTPTSDSVSRELIEFISGQLQAEVKAVVINHFHNDCLGGLGAFHEAGIVSYAHTRTKGLARKDGSPEPQVSFKKTKKLRIGGEKIILYYPGEAHAPDNTVGYVPSEKVLFGGCMLKSLSAGKGYLGDASVQEWSNTISKVSKRFPKAEILIPGHGKVGNRELLRYTEEMFSAE